MKLHMIARATDGALKAHHVVPSPRQTQYSRLLATRNHFAFVLHPMVLFAVAISRRPSGLHRIAQMAGRRTATSWMMVSRNGDGEPLFLEAPAAFIRHALNAYEEDDGIVADFVGYDTPDHFAPHNALFYRLMQGELGTAKAPRQAARLPHRLHARSDDVGEEDRRRRLARVSDDRSARRAAKHAIGYSPWRAPQ